MQIIRAGELIICIYSYIYTGQQESLLYACNTYYIHKSARGDGKLTKALIINNSLILEV